MQRLLNAYARLLANVDESFLRYLYPLIDWNNRLIIIKGARGVGKTTMLLQHIKKSFPDTRKALYASLDNMWFTTNSIVDLAEYHYTHGGTHLFLDEIHRYHRFISTQVGRIHHRRFVKEAPPIHPCWTLFQRIPAT